MTKQHRQQGFTLVELAIVLTIIGLLIGGILKGQQLMQNARITATISQLNGIQSAHTTFRDTYGSIAGDMPNAPSRVPDCANCGLTIGATSGDGVVGDPNWNMVTFQSASYQGTPTTATVAQETVLYWLELAKAGLISGVTTDGINNIPASFSGSLPAAKVGGGFTVGFANATMAVGIPGRGALPANMSGTVLTLMSTPTNLNALGSVQVLLPSSAGQMDRKMDDGLPGSGTVQAYGVPANCYNTTVAPGTAAAPTYLESATTKDCGLFFLVGN